eukprot:gene76-292_t
MAASARKIGLNAAEEHLVEKFREKSRGTVQSAIFKHLKFYDLHNQGCIDFKAFSRALEQYFIGVDVGIVEEIFDRYSADGCILAIKDFSDLVVSGVRRSGTNESSGGSTRTGQRSSDESEGQRSLPLRSTAGGSDAATAASSRGANVLAKTGGGGSPVVMASLSPRTLKSMSVASLSDFRDRMYRMGVRRLFKLLQLFRDGDPRNTRTVDEGGFLAAMLGLASLNAEGSACDAAPVTFARYNPRVVCYDEFLGELKCPFSDARRAAVRSAFRKLDGNTEGLVDLVDLRKKYNVSRHPFAVMSRAEPQELHDEFFETMEQYCKFRRGLEMRLTPTGSR